ncbi:hypothetical protein E1288_41455, partial [Saccharopolyspora elongata]
MPTTLAGPRLTRHAARGDHYGPLPIAEGTVIRLTGHHLPSGGKEIRADLVVQSRRCRGWSRPLDRHPHQLRHARSLTADLRRTWEKPAPPER